MNSALSSVNSDTFIIFVIIAFFVSLIITIAITFTIIKRTKRGQKGDKLPEFTPEEPSLNYTEASEENEISEPEALTPEPEKLKQETQPEFPPDAYKVKEELKKEQINPTQFNINDLKMAINNRTEKKEEKAQKEEIEWSTPVSRVSKSEVEEIELKKAISDKKNNKPIPAAARSKNDAGVEFVRKGELLKAIPNYIEATELAPHYTLAFYNLGNAYFELNDHDKAIKNYERVITLSPRDEFAYYNLAASYYKKDDLTKATQYYQQAVEISPGDVVIHYNLGKVYEQLSDIEKAIEAYKKAVSLNPRYANAHFNMAELLKYKGLYRQAIQEYQLYLKYNPDAEDAMEVKKVIVDLMSK